MFVAQPWRLRFKVNPTRHTISASQLFNHFPNKEATIDGNVKAVVAKTEDLAKEQMIAQVSEYTQSIAKLEAGGIEPTDFILIYSINEVKEGLFWGGGGLVREHDFRK